MDLTIPLSASSEQAAAILLAAVVVGMGVVCAILFKKYRKLYFGYWALAWSVFALRMGAILSFISSEAPIWLYWHQVATGWTALAFLWAALVFSEQLVWRPVYMVFVLFPPVWSYVAIYRLDNFAVAAGPAVLFLSAATFWTGWVFLRYWRQVRSGASLFLALALIAWAVHHLDYPFLRARGVFNPWGYYLDLGFVLSMGVGILFLVQEDLGRGLKALSELSGDLQSRGSERGELLPALLRRMSTLPAVRGSAMYRPGDPDPLFVLGSGVCTEWGATDPRPAVRAAVEKVFEHGRPEVIRGRGGGAQPFTAAFPILQGDRVSGAFVMVADARDPFTALDEEFLLALGQQVGAAMQNEDLYARLQARREELERLQALMVQQHEEERRRLSRELHDETAQVFAAVNLQLGVLREQVGPELADSLDRVLELVGTGIRSIRSVTRELRPTVLTDLGLLPALRGLARDFRDRFENSVSFQSPNELSECSPEAELALYRALQEALSNAVRHAQAKTVSVKVEVHPHGLHLIVEDDGCGFDEESDSDGSGLAGMRERLADVGGSVTLTSPAGDGVRLVATVPAGTERREDKEPS